MNNSTATGVVVCNQPNGSDTRSRIRIENKLLTVKADLNVGTWLHCEYNPETSYCTAVKPIEPPIHTRYFCEPNNVSEFHLVFYGPIYKKRAFNYRCKYLGEVGTSSELGKKNPSTTYAEFEYKKSLETLTSTKWFEDVSDEMRERLPLDLSAYKLVDGTIDSKQYMADAYKALKQAKVKVIDEDDVKAQTKSIKREVEEQTVPDVKQPVKPKLRNLFTVDEKTRLFVRMQSPVVQANLENVENVQANFENIQLNVVEDPVVGFLLDAAAERIAAEQIENQKEFCGRICRVMFQSDHEFVSWRMLQRNYKDTFSTSITRELNRLGYEKPSNFFDQYPDVFEQKVDSTGMQYFKIKTWIENEM